MNKRIYLNNDWLFAENWKMEMSLEDFHDEKMEQVRLPHTCKETPYNYFDEHIYQMISGYRRKLEVPAEWEGKQILLTFEGIGHESEVFLNGEKIGEHHCGYTAFTLDLSKKVKIGQENVLAVKVNSKEDINVPPFGFVIDYMTYGGIYRDVYLDIKEENYLEDVFLKAEILAGNTKEKGKVQLHSEITLKKPQADLKICQYICRKNIQENNKENNRETNKEMKECRLLGEATISENATSMTLSFPVEEVLLWSPEMPVLYEIKTQLKSKEEILDESVISFGFRKAEFQRDGFYLNGEKYKIRGLNRHQSYPYVGYAMPKSMQRMDADVLKKELGLNAVRTSHYPQSHDFINRCDEIGLLVFTEMPGWQHIGDEAWKAQAVINVQDMVKQYRNHTSIILWGVRINESPDDDGFYEKTNEAARKLDATRQTGGVRAYKKSNLLEDVYTYNDFSHSGDNPGCEPKKKVTSNNEKAYLISEYNGHMYPTKSFDWEEHRVEHAIRHANVLDAVIGQEDIAGCFGWCMTDYNTHKDFGSGDRICYHGVMDMFRNPKLAADIYACQQEEEPVLNIASSMDIGEHPGCNRGNTWIFTNADSVKMYKNNRFIKEYHKEDSPYRNLKHGPLLIDDFIGDAIEKGENLKPSQAKELTGLLNQVARYGLYRLPKLTYFKALKMMVSCHITMTQAVGLYNKYVGDWGGTSTVYKFEAVKDGKVVKSVIKEPMTKVSLQAKADHLNLMEEHTYDVAAIRIKALDENGNLLHFFGEPVQLVTEGPIELIGEPVISLKGGMGGTYVKTLGTKGSATLRIKTAQAEEVRINFEISI